MGGSLVDQIDEGMSKEVQEFIVNVGWTHKIQAIQASKYQFWAGFIEGLQIIASGITASGLIGMIFVENRTIKIGTAFVACISFIASNLLKTWNPRRLEKVSRQAAVEHWNLQHRALHLLQMINRKSILPNEAELALKSLVADRSAANDHVVNAWQRSVSLARNKLKAGRDNDYTDDIPYFIPKYLRRDND